MDEDGLLQSGFKFYPIGRVTRWPKPEALLLWPSSNDAAMVPRLPGCRKAYACTFEPLCPAWFNTNRGRSYGNHYALKSHALLDMGCMLPKENIGLLF